VIVACVREVIDQLNQVSLSGKEYGGNTYNPHSKDRIYFSSEETSSLSTWRCCCHQHGREAECGMLWYKFC